MWTKENIPDQTGKTALVTGANSGIGYEIALALYAKGAHMIVAGRDAANAERAVLDMKQSHGKGSLEVGLVDLSNLQSVREFAARILDRHFQLHVLINNAGVMTPPPSKTAEGYELQFGVNFLGHFALTALLYPLLSKTIGARIVTMSSGAHKMVSAVDFDNLKSEKSYDAFREYSISKLANLQFVTQLTESTSRTENQVIALAAHPGVTQSGLSRYMSPEAYNAALEQFGELMPTWQGALPALYAATSPLVSRGGYYGPDGENELTGYPAPVQMSDAARDLVEAAKLWKYAEKETGIYFPYPQR